MKTWEVIETLPLQGCEPNWQQCLKAWELESERALKGKCNAGESASGICAKIIFSFGNYNLSVSEVLLQRHFLNHRSTVFSERL